MSHIAREAEMEMRLREMREDPDAYFKACRTPGGWVPPNERDRRPHPRRAERR